MPPWLQLWCITGDDTEEEDAEGGLASDGEEEEEGSGEDDVAAVQNDRQASHAQASTKDADTAMTDATNHGESLNAPRGRCKPTVFSYFFFRSPTPPHHPPPPPQSVFCRALPKVAFKYILGLPLALKSPLLPLLQSVLRHTTDTVCEDAMHFFQNLMLLSEIRSPSDFNVLGK